MRLLLNLILSLSTGLGTLFLAVQYFDTQKEFYLVLVGFVGALFLAVRGYFFISGRHRE